MVPPETGHRAYWIDNLRTLVIALVVNMHACCTYSHVGGWYIRDEYVPPEPIKITFGLWQGHLQSFFMGLLFFISAFLAQKSILRRGVRGFVTERLWRLGAPTLFYMLLLHPFIIGVINPYGLSDDQVLRYLKSYYLGSDLKWLAGTGPLWFTFALLGMCLLLAGWTAWRGPAALRRTGEAPTRLGWRLLALGSLLVVTTFLTRLVWPVGTSVYNLQLCYFPQYLIAFVLGLQAARGGWLEAVLRLRLGVRLGWAALLIGPVLLGAVALANPHPPGVEPVYLGGMNVAAFSLAFWEQATGLCLGLAAMALAYRFFNRETAVTRWLHEHSFAVYLLHAAWLVAAQAWLAPLTWGPWLKALLLTGIGLTLSYLSAALFRRIPLLGRIV